MQWLCPLECRTMKPSADSDCRHDVSNRHTGICFLVCCPVCFVTVCRLLWILPLHMALSLSLFLCLPFCHLIPSYSVYFYECLQYLMEAKKAQQSLESTYKQLDSVSLKKASIILDVSCWICFFVFVFFYGVCVLGSLCLEGEILCKQPGCMFSAVFHTAIFFYSKNRWTERKLVPHFRPL